VKCRLYLNKIPMCLIGLPCSLILNLLAAIGTLLSDACLLTGEVTQIVEFSATHLTDLVDGDAVNVRALDGEDTLHTDGAAHLANGETLLLSVTADLDDYATIELDALLVTLDNFVSYSHGVTSLERGVALASSKCFFSNFK